MIKRLKQSTLLQWICASPDSTYHSMRIARAIGFDTLIQFLYDDSNSKLPRIQNDSHIHTKTYIGTGDPFKLFPRTQYETKAWTRSRKSTYRYAPLYSRLFLPGYVNVSHLFSSWMDYRIADSARAWDQFLFSKNRYIGTEFRIATMESP